jgi:hypothetical protein
MEMLPGKKPRYRSKRRTGGKRFSLASGMEKTLIRVMAFSVVVLALFQATTMTNPVNFYLKFAGDIDTPAFQYSQYATDAKAQGQKPITLYFSVSPESSVLVKQNENVLGVIQDEAQIDVLPGTIQLDARHIHQPVTVDVIVNNQKQSIRLNGDTKNVNIQVESNQAS